MTETKKGIEKSLPKDWRWVKLGEVCEKMSNGANAKQSDDKIGFPISRIETIWNETIDLGRVKYIEESDATFVEKYSLWKDDILFSHINSDIHLGKTAIFKNQIPTLIHGINLLLIRLNKDTQADFFNYQFRYKRRIGEFISIAQKSVNQSSINQPKLKNLDFVLPPIFTQQAIVSKIEELFSELDKGIENLRTAQQQLKTYRQAVLKWAYEGRLTNENVKDGELPKGWKWVTMNEVCNKIGDIDHKMPKHLDTGYPYVSTKDFTDDLKISFERAKYISEEDYLNLARKIRPERGDIIFPRYGTIGKNILVDFDKEFLVSYSCAVIKPNKDLVLSKYLYLYSLSPKITDEIRKYVVETTQANIGIASIKSFVFPLPTNEDQNKVVQEIESRLSVADKMEESITQSLQQAVGLRQSILKKAFEGKLI